MGSAEAPPVFGHEEALGYVVTPSGVRDKDGIPAARAVALPAAEPKAPGPPAAGPPGRAGPGARLVVTGQLSARVEDLSIISRPWALRHADACTQDAAALAFYSIELINRTSTAIDAEPLRQWGRNCRDCRRIADDTQ